MLCAYSLILKKWKVINKENYKKKSIVTTEIKRNIIHEKKKN